MGRVIKPVSASRQRKTWMRDLLAAVQRAEEGSDPSELDDLIAFTLDRLHSIIESVETTAAAWEKRQYWVKADRFRAEWAWAQTRLTSLQTEWRNGGAQAALGPLGDIAQHLAGITVGAKLANLRPWRGAAKRKPAE